MLKNLITVLLSMVLAMAVAEAALRWVHTPRSLTFRMQVAGQPTGDQNLQFDRDAFRFEPGSTGGLIHPEYRNAVTIDRLGFRNTCGLDGAGPIKAVGVGDSFLFGVGVEDDETISCVLRRALSIRSYSISIPGAGPAKYLRLINRHGRAVREELAPGRRIPALIYLYLGNDIVELTHSRIDAAATADGDADATAGSAGRVPVSAAINRFVFHDSPLRHSYLLNLMKASMIRRVKEQRDAAEFIVLREGSAVFRRDPPASVSERHVEMIRGNLDRFRRAARGAGFTDAVFVLIPMAVIVEPDLFRSEVALQGYDGGDFDANYARQAIALAAGTEFRTLDVADCLAARPARRSFYYVNDNHLTARGVENLVACMADWLPSVIAAR